MDKEITWTEVANICEEYKEVLTCEEFGHKIIVDKNGTIRWEDYPSRAQEIMDQFGAKNLNDLFGRCGADKNDPIIRELYKCIGYSINGFWEIFYWEVNNDRADEYNCRKCKDAD